MGSRYSAILCPSDRKCHDMVRPGGECCSEELLSASDKAVPSFTQDIYPILKRAVMISWVVEQKNRYHGAGGNFLSPGRLSKLADNSEEARASREGVFKWLMKPNTHVDPNTPPPQLPPTMPKVNSGLDPDNPERGEYTALTEDQYNMMERWSRGDFHADWTGEPIPVPFEKHPWNKDPMR